MPTTLELAKAHIRMNMQDPACCLYGIRAALRDGSELFHLNHRELLELHHYASTLMDEMPCNTPPTAPLARMASSPAWA